MLQHRRLDAWTYSQECFKVLQAYRSGHITAHEQQEEFALLRMLFGLPVSEPLLFSESQDSQIQQV